MSLRTTRPSVAKAQKEAALDAVRETAESTMTRLNVELPTPLFRALKVRVAQDGVSVADVVRQLVANYLHRVSER